MSTARDELQDLIDDTAVGSRFDGVGVSNPDVIADSILAAGYRKPRTITTVEELDALPVGSVVLHDGRAFQHYPAYPAPFDEYQKWKCGDGGFVRSTNDGSMILPATVLYEPSK